MERQYKLVKKIWVIKERVIKDVSETFVTCEECKTTLTILRKLDN